MNGGLNTCRWCVVSWATPTPVERHTGRSLDKGQDQSGWTTSAAQEMRIRSITVTLMGGASITVTMVKMLELYAKVNIIVEAVNMAECLHA